MTDDTLTAQIYESEQIEEYPEALPDTNEGARETENTEGGAVDYEALVNEDMRILRESFRELSEEDGIGALRDPLRYGALRDLGLSPKEAYLATGGKRRAQNNRTHLNSSVPRHASSPIGDMPRAEYAIAKELFSDLGDKEIRNLYRRVTQ